MTTVTLRIAVDKSGASENIGAVKNDLRGMGEEGERSGQQASRGVDGLSSAINGARAAVTTFLAVYAGIQALSGVVRLADEYQGLSDRLRLATGSTEEFTAAQSGVFAIAQQTGSALGAVSDLYARLARSTSDLGLSQGELLTITQSITQAFTVSGASAQETDSAIRQLGQAFAAGALRGDEFNSIAENAPRLQQALADSLGVTKGQLRDMAAQGQLTSEVLARGLLQQAPAISREFDQMGQTVGRAFQTLSNAVLRFVGEASEATGAGEALAAVITGIANGLPAFVAGLTAVAAGYTAVKAAAILANASLLTTTGLLAGAAAAVGLLIAAYAGYKLGEYLVNEFTIVQAAVRSLYVGVNDAWTAIKVGALAAFLAIKNAWNFAVESMGARLADLIDAFVELSEIELPFGLRADFAYGQAEAMTTLSRSLRETTSATVANNAATSALQGEIDRTRAEAEEYAAQMFDVVDAHSASKIATDATTVATVALTPAMDASAAATRAMAEATETAATAQQVLRNIVTESTTGLSDFAREALSEVVPATQAATTGVEEFGEATQRSGESASGWAQYWGDALGAATDAFGDFVASGFKSFEDFGRALKDIAKRIISDLVSQFLRSQIVIPIQTAITNGGGLSGAFSALTGTTGGTLALIGGAIAALASVFSGDQETILRVRSQQFNGDRQARGRETSALGDIFVRGESLGDGAAVEVAAAIRDFDNIIAGFLSPDQLALVRTRLNAVNDTFRDGAANTENALDARFSAILGALGSDIQDFVGTVGPLEDRVQRLADAMTVTSAAATGLISSDFGEVADVLERFRAGGEGLSDTFGRIVSGMSLVDDALLLLDGTFSGTRLQAANFAGELIALSGGFDQFAARLNGALETLFSQDERNQFIADQSQAALNTVLTDLNIQGTGVESIRNQLRDALREALSAGNAALVDQILTAANALGAFGSAVEALGADAVAAANATVFGGTSAAGGGNAGTAGAGTGSTPVATQLQASQAAARALERHTGLLEQIATNTRQTVDPATANKTARDGSDADRQAAALLGQIKTLIESAVRSQAQESIKKTTGANNRAAA